MDREYIREYIKKVNELYQSGKATEHSYRDLLSSLVKSMADVSVINEPTREKFGAPDYIVSKKGIPIGYMEAKDIGDPDLAGKKKNREQFNRYKESLDNIIFTDYLTFHRYRKGERGERGERGESLQEVSIGRYDENKVSSLPNNFPAFEGMIKDFCSTFTQTITSPKELAGMMAGKARLLADIIEKALLGDSKSHDNSSLQEQFLAFKKILIHDITAKEFADVYAQTVTYGMFAARLNDNTLDSFTRQEAAELIPKSNPFLRKLFGYISGPDIDDRIKWIVDDLANVFLASNVREILSNYGHKTQTEDPIIHFYETFLSEYDPKLRKSRGVWYTPKPVVHFIVQAVDEVLKHEFAISTGLADTSKTMVVVDEQDKKHKQEIEVHRVQILDPAAGTGTFLTEVVALIHARFKGQEGIWADYVKNHLLPRLNGFELLMASYAMAHLQLDQYLVNTGYDSSKARERLRVFLTNSLEEAHPDTGTLFATWLSEEANEANHIKRDTPVMCVLGNPPYSGESANQGEWIMKLMEDYKKEPGGKEKLKERNPKWINDDYVKFIRYGQYFIEKNGSGVLAFINPHGYLDNPTFRGMRWHLLKTYDKIYTIDLHGNAKKKEVAPDGSKDENVFDIQQGVSINVFIKTGKKKPNELGKVYHYDLYGRREEKYDFLNTNTLNTIEFREIPNQAPMYFMVQKNFDLEKQYTKGFSVLDLLPLNSVGIVTARDNFTIQSTKNQVRDTIETFLDMDNESARIKFNLGKDVRDWQVNYAKMDLDYHYPEKGKFTKISYRPFDDRWTFFTGKSKGFHCYPRNDVMQHFLKGKNVGFVFRRQQPENLDLYIFISNKIICDGLIRSDNKGGESIAPLYCYPEDDSMEQGHYPNLDKNIIGEMEKALGFTFNPQPAELFASGEKDTFTPMDVLDYIYAVLHSPRYRKTYQEFLKIDFPRIPYPGGAKAKTSFRELVKLGGKLRRVHLLESVEDVITSYPKPGDNTVAKPMFNKGKVYINDTQYFTGVPEVAWNFYIGGYQPAQKWLKDRKGGSLTYDDISHYHKIIVALTRTHELMRQIDKYKFW